MSKLVIDNLYSYLTDLPEKFQHNLWKKLRFPIKDRHFCPAVQNHTWDGYIDFFKINSNKTICKFLTGLLPEIYAALRFYGLETEITDRRIPVEFKIKEISPDFMGNGIILRDYQCDFINQIIKHQRCIVPSPTGSGKTLIMSALVKSLPEKTPTLILSDRTSIVHQNYDELIKFGVKDVGIFTGKIQNPNFITVSTIQSVDKLKNIYGKIQVLIVDEIHKCMTSAAKKCYNSLPNASLRFSMSATAFKWDGKDLVQKFSVKGFFGPLLKTKFTENESGLLTAKELQNRNVLSGSKCWFIKVDKPILKYMVYTDVIEQGIASNVYLHNLICKIARKLKGRTLILVERIAQGDAIAEILGSEIGWVSGKDNQKTRKEIIEKLKYSDNFIAIATRNIFDDGIDTYLENLINGSSGLSHHVIVQRVGRGLRKADDKELLNYFDFNFTNNEYLMEHSKKRIKILKKEGHRVVLFDHDDLEKMTEAFK